ncbi:competence type IV pilus assembly protein ComGB [Neobacillus sp. SM06]|uniref:competence type IV pilus assembly protein ComGB n=1 Tax=Neobacillus sp. SM06 TaxID=3422492 RepID=UPI003D2D6852
MRQTKWPVFEQAQFLKRTGELLRRGYPIAEAIESLSFQLPASRQPQLVQLLEGLKKGLAFHDVLAELRFHEELIGYVYFAQQHGSFAEALFQGSELVLKKEKDKQKLLHLLQYPLVLIMLTGFMFIFVEKSLLPRFSTLFQSMNLEENFFMKIVNGFGKNFPIFLVSLIALVAVSTIYYLFIFRKTPILLQKVQLVRIPLVGRFLKLVYTHYFSIQLSFLITGGISVAEALALFEANSRQAFYATLAKKLKDGLVTGEKLETILQSFPFFEKEFALIVKHGQENGKLGQELFFYSQHCMAIAEELTAKSLKMIQPLLYVLIGLLIVSMYLAILLPMFHLMDGI